MNASEELSEADAALIPGLFHLGHEGVGWEDAVVADQPERLRPQRKKRKEIDQTQRPQKKPAHQEIRRRFDVLSPPPLRQPGKPWPMLRHQTVCSLGGPGKKRDPRVAAQRPRPPRIHRQRAKHRLGSGIHLPVGRDKLHRRVELRAWNFREPAGHARVLNRQIIQRRPGQLPPAPNPEAAKAAVAIVDHQWLGRWRSHAEAGAHIPVLTQIQADVKRL